MSGYHVGRTRTISAIGGMDTILHQLRLQRRCAEPISEHWIGPRSDCTAVSRKRADDSVRDWKMKSQFLVMANRQDQEVAEITFPAASDETPMAPT